MNSKWRALFGTALLAAVCTATAQGQYVVLHHLTPSEGGGAISLIEGTDGNLYGTARFGGNGNSGFGFGTLFRMSPDGSVFTVLHQFDGANGAQPLRRLLEASDGNFYGTTSEGGNNDVGTVFKMTPSGVVTVIHHFNGTDGAYPVGGLIEGSGGDFYGTTGDGGADGCGTIFRMSPPDSLAVLHEFTCAADGGGPEDRLLEGSDGKFYGTTNCCGGDNGTIFRMSPSAPFNLEVLHHFTGDDTYTVVAGLVEGSDGYYYGTTSGGEWGATDNFGSVFRISPSGGFQTLHLLDFDNGDGAFPTSGLVVGSDGNLYGRAQFSVFRVSPSGAFTVLAPCCGELYNDGLIESSDGFLYAGGDAEIIRLSSGNSATATAGQSVTVSTAPQMPGYAGVTATLTNDGSGTPAVTVQNFPQDPGTSGIIDVGGKYVDLKVTGADLADTVAANFYYPTTITGSSETNLQLFYFTGSAWAVVLSSGGVDPAKDTIDNLDGTISGGRFAVLFDATSTPKVTELTGTVFTSSVAVSYGVCLLYDPTKAHKKGSTVPIKIQLCDGVRNLAAADVGVTALGVVLLSTSAPGTLEDSGNANPDSNFRYDSSLGESGGYIYNLSTGGLQRGTYALRLKAGADVVIHSAEFQVK